MTNRSDEKAEFLGDVLVTAIEHRGYGFPGIIQWECDIIDGNPNDFYAVIYDRYESEDSETEPTETWRVDIDTIAKGFGNARKAYPASERNDWVKSVFEAYDENDGGNIDVVGALFILECAIFGKGMYA